MGISTSIASVALCLRTAQTAIGPAFALSAGAPAVFAAIIVRACTASLLVGLGAMATHILFRNLLDSIDLRTLLLSGLITGAGLGFVLARWGTLIAAVVGPQFAPWGTVPGSS